MRSHSSESMLAVTVKRIPSSDWAINRRSKQYTAHQLAVDCSSTCSTVIAVHIYKNFVLSRYNSKQCHSGQAASSVMNGVTWRYNFKELVTGDTLPGESEKEKTAVPSMGFEPATSSLEHHP